MTGPKTKAEDDKPYTRPLIPQAEIDANKRDIKYIAIHASATPPSMYVDRERIKKWHLARGFVDIGYHYLIMRDGTIVKGRDLDGDGYVLEEIGAHVKSFNKESIALCWIGGVAEDDHDEAEDNRTPEQKRTLKRLVKELCYIYPGVKVRGHRDFPNVSKDCPCYDVISWCESEGIEHN